MGLNNWSFCISSPSSYILQVYLFPEVCYVSDIYYLKCTLIQLVLQWVCWSSDILILKYSSVQLDFSLYLPGVLFLSPYVPLPTSLLHSFSHLIYIHVHSSCLDHIPLQSNVDLLPCSHNMYICSPHSMYHKPIRSKHPDSKLKKLQQTQFAPQKYVNTDVKGM